MYAVTYISLVDVHGNKIFSYKRQQELGPVSCFLFACGKTITKEEATSVSIPANIASKVHDVKFSFITNNNGPSFARQMEGIDKTLILLTPLLF